MGFSPPAVVTHLQFLPPFLSISMQKLSQVRGGGYTSPTPPPFFTTLQVVLAFNHVVLVGCFSFQQAVPSNKTNEFQVAYRLQPAIPPTICHDRNNKVLVTLSVVVLAGCRAITTKHRDRCPLSTTSICLARRRDSGL